MLDKLPDSVGHALFDTRAGLDKTVHASLGLRNGMGLIDLRSIAFADHAPLPQRYTDDGPGLSPPLQWSGVPGIATSLALIVEDADSPTPQPLVHAIVVDLDPREAALAEGALDSPDHEGIGLTEGRNSYLRTAWLPPDPPPGHGMHRYVFQLFALVDGAPFDSTPGRDALVAALSERAIASGSLIGTYERPDGMRKIPLRQAVGVTTAGVESGEGAAPEPPLAARAAG